jgi:hypothetical protein
MATEGTPYQGLDYCAGRIYASHLSLVCYTNAADSLSDTTVYADLTQPASANGYAPLTLDGTWTISNGTVTYLKNGANPGWTATGSWSVTVNGVAMVDISAGKILHFRDCSVPFVAANLKRLESDITTLVTP